MSKYIDAEKAERDGWTMQRTFQSSPTEMTCEMKKPTDLPAADVVEVVRCKECVMWDGSFTLNGQKKCLNMTFCTDGDFYCWWGSKE